MSPHKRTHEPPAIFELLLPLAGLLLVGVFFLPGFRQLLGLFLFFALGLAVLSLALGLALYLRHLKKLTADGVFNPAVPAAPPDTWTLELLRELEWKRFEELVAAYLLELGYTSESADSAATGRAVPLFKGGRIEPVILLQCRVWDAGTVGLEPLRALQAAMGTEAIRYGAYYTAGEFTAEAEAFAHGKVIDLVNGPEFLVRLRQLTPAMQQKFLEEATAGDYQTPSCPGCGIKFVLPTEEEEPSVATQVWVCRNHPQCQRTLPVAEVSSVQ